MDYVRYLCAKRTVDDRALNTSVLNEFERYIQYASKQHTLSTLRVIEVGAGVGDMFLRLLRRNAVFSATRSIHYTLLDVKAELLKYARQNIESELLNHRVEPTINLISLPLSSPSIADGCGIHQKSCENKEIDEPLEDLSISERITVSFVVDDGLNYLQSHKASFDVVIAAAVLDLWELESATNVLLGALDINSGVNAFYFPVNFDGTTSFYPESCEGNAYDHLVEVNYHTAMGQRLVQGKQVHACYTGRFLAPILQRRSATVSSIGSSSWIVYPNNDGNYECDERFFLSCILDFVEATLHDKAINKPENDSGSFVNYIHCRREQLKDGKLFYLAHNIDVCGHLKREIQS
ncbi:unnamed protein product [Agarophyton chilense]